MGTVDVGRDQAANPGCGLEDEKMLEGIYNFDFGEEFLVLVIRFVDGPENEEAYCHRLNRVRSN